MKEIVSEEKQLYLELFELYKHRVKTKHLTYEAFRFERESVKAGKMSIKKANTIRDGMFEYLSNGTDSNKLIKYMKHQYPIPPIDGKKQKKGGKQV